MRYLKALAFFLIATLFAVAAGNEAALDSLAEAGHWKQVRAIVQQQAPAGEAEKAYWSARVKHAFGDLGGAETLIGKAISLDGKKAAYHLELGSIQMDQLSGGTGFFGAMRLSHNAKNELDTALSLEPKNVDVMLLLMGYYWNAPGIGGGDKKKAREMADRIAQIDAPRGYLAQAKLSEMAGGSEAAKVENLLKLAVQSAPRDYTARIALAEYYLLQAKDYTAAAKEAKAAMAMAPDRSRAYADLVTVYAHEQKWAEVDELLAQAEKSVPEDLQPYYQAGKVLYLEGHEYDRAELYFHKYLSQEPEGRQPTLANAHWRLGLVLEKKGKQPQAIAELQEAVRLQPNFTHAKKDLDRLR